MSPVPMPVIYHGDARNLPLPDDTVDLVVTSPPYFGLRSYTDGGEHYETQIGSEATPAEFVDALIDVTRECVRVLKQSGSLWVNLGDKYAGGGGQWEKDERPDPRKRRAASGKIGNGGAVYGLRPKSLIGIPWRFALRCIDDLGLILRAEVIWSKPNGLPESVTDRVRRSHEQWFHLAKSPRYYSAVDEIREPHTGGAHSSGNGASRKWVSSNSGRNHRALDTDPSEYNPLGKLPGSVWEIATQPLRVPAELGISHFAAFPMEWPRRIIQGWSPREVCTACGEGRRPVSARELTVDRGGRKANVRVTGVHYDDTTTLGRERTVRITRYACACPDTAAPATPGVVLDPFSGTGTTALVATMLGRRGIGVDASADYCRLAQWRASDPKQRAKAAG